VHVDLAFLRKDMPRLAAHLPYRVVVSIRNTCNCSGAVQVYTEPDQG